METSPDTCEMSLCLCPGRSLTVDVWSPSHRGLSGRLMSYSQSPRSTESCLSFFYKLYGPNAGKNKRAAQGGDSHETHASSPNFLRNNCIKAAPPIQPHLGTLNVKLTDTVAFEQLLWTRSGAHGNLWHEAHCPVPAQITDFQVGKYSLNEIMSQYNSLYFRVFVNL